MKYFLIGLPMSGKTIQGKRLSEHFKCKFIDLNDLVISTEREKIIQIIKHSEEEDIVVSTNSYTALDKDLLDIMLENGKVIYLKCELEHIEERIQKSYNLPKEDIETVMSIYNLQIEYYRKASYKCYAGGSEEETFQNILKIIKL